MNPQNCGRSKLCVNFVKIKKISKRLNNSEPRKNPREIEKAMKKEKVGKLWTVGVRKGKTPSDNEQVRKVLIAPNTDLSKDYIAALGFVEWLNIPRFCYFAVAPFKSEKSQRPFFFSWPTSGWLSQL